MQQTKSAEPSKQGLNYRLHKIQNCTINLVPEAICTLSYSNSTVVPHVNKIAKPHGWWETNHFIRKNQICNSIFRGIPDKTS